MSEQNIDMAKVEQFGGKIMTMLNHAALSLMTSIGHRTGLFDVLAESGPSTSEELASRASCNERYVREWLGAMVTGQIVEYDPETRKYHLPAEHAALLIRAAAPTNLAVTTQFIGLLGSVEDKIVEVFEKGGGVPYSAYPRFQEIMAEDSAQSTVAALVSGILPLVPGLIERLEKGIDVLDVGCGQGVGMNLLARTFPNSRFTGHDFSEAGIARARAEAEANGTSNVTFEVKDAAKLDATQAYDLITTFDAIHDQVHPERVLSNIARALRPGGVYLMQEFQASAHAHENIEHPMGIFLYTISCMHCTTVSMAHGGPGLGAMWGHQTMNKMLREAGFQSVETKRLPQDVLNEYYICRTA
jgi:ubiquinone/menaquinone biosynthesis C-methylase UbiE